MKRIGYLIIFLLPLTGCSIKKYLPKIFNPDMAKINVNQTTLYYEKAGKGIPIIFIHGFGLDTRMWDPQFETFAHKYTVIRYDLRGFGQSALPDEAVMYTHHEDLNSLLKEKGISKAILAGLSLGGRVAASFALTYPDQVLGLILIDSVLEGYAMKDYKMDYIYEEAKKDISGALKLWLAHPTFEATHKNAEVSEYLNKIVLDYSGWHFIHKNPLIPLKPPCKERLHEIKVPALILVGEHDLPDFQDIANILDQNIPNSELHIIPDAGHMSNMEQPSVVNKLMQEFINQKIKDN